MKPDFPTQASPPGNGKLLLESAIERVKTNGVLTPLLWLCGLLVPAALIASYFENWVSVLFVFLVTLVIITTVGFYCYFAIKAPDRLQSEDYQLERRKIDLMRDDRVEAGKVLVIDNEPSANTSLQVTK